MSARSIMLIAAALLLTVGTMFIARSWLANQRAAPVTEIVQQPTQTKVLVARADLPAGTFVTEQHLRWQVWPDDNLPDSYLVEGQFQSQVLHGAVVRRGIANGTPIIRTLMIKPGDRGFLAAVLRPGWRAYSIKVNATSSIAGLVFPGDRVDLLMTHKIRNTGSGLEQQVSETVLTNLRVLAIDQTLDDQDDQPRVGKTVTFEVTPKQAEILAVADTIGRLSLSLRSLAKNEAELKKLIESGKPLAETNPTRGRTATLDFEASVLKNIINSNVAVVRGTKARTEKVAE